ncbi:volume-regulated anion channel subunit LRRC8A [Exaiptasia diaphana]|uniref:LRRC8 pannexin-like TM region domain-containing protein n=1 Tax=Exaiptasia diaphana TaxID=2652724 RepID=A0A913YV82_EXADI|nr:volume-regulated anion channel subunit LRRC8A [Exaiptasia diaphana]
MFPVDQLQRFQVINPDHKFIKPWWDTFTDYIATALLMMAVLAGVMQATQSDLVCVPAIDCSLSHNQSFNHSGVCQGSKSTMLLKLPDRRLYDYVETVCGRTAVHCTRGQLQS